MVKSLATNTKFACNLRFILTVFNSLLYICYLIRGQSLLSSPLFCKNDPSSCRSRINDRSNSANAPITESIRYAIGESSPVKAKLSFRNSISYRIGSAVLRADANHRGCAQDGPCYEQLRRLRSGRSRAWLPIRDDAHRDPRP